MTERRRLLPALSLRLRLVLSTIVIAAVGLTGLNLAISRFVRNHLVSRLDHQLDGVSGRFALQRFGEQTGEVRRPGGMARPRAGTGPGAVGSTPVIDPRGRGRNDRRPMPGGDLYLELRTANGKRLADPRVLTIGDARQVRLDLPEHLPTPTARGVFFDVNGTGGGVSHYRAVYRTVTSTDGRRFSVLAAAGADEIVNTLDRLRTIQWGASAAVLLAMALGGWMLVHLSLRSLRRIEEAAATIAAGDLAHRIPGDGERTEVGRLRRSLNEMIDEIQTAFQAKEESEERLRRFVADASHELRTPLTAIRGYAQLHRRTSGGGDPTVDHTIGRIEEAGTRMSLIVEDLLMLARGERLGDELARERVDAGALAGSVVEDARIAHDGAVVSVELDGALSLVGDPLRLHQAIGNLVDNALVHTPIGTPVVVSVRREGAEVVIAVRDRGPGIAPEHLGHVTEAFYRADPGRSRHTGGSGLGLAIVDAVARAHGGSLEVASVVGDGSSFTLRLPATD